MHVFCFDFETHLITGEQPFPTAVCMSYWAFDPDCPDPSSATVVSAADGIDILAAELGSDSLLVGCETAFDVLVSVRNAEDPERLHTAWRAAYQAGRVQDIKHRQSLIDISIADRLPRYSMQTIAEKLQTATQPDKENPWRLRFAELAGVPISEYPPEAYRYSLEDAIVTGECWIEQELFTRDEHPYYPRHVGSCLQGQSLHDCAAFALKEFAGHGLRTDRETVERFRHATEQRLTALQEKLCGARLLKKEYRLDREAVAARAGLTARTKTGGVSLPRKHLRAHPDPLVRMAASPRLHYEALAEAGLASVVRVSRSTSVARKRMLSVRSSGGYSVATTERGNVCLDNDSCQQSGDELLADYADYTATVKLLSTDFALLEAAAEGPLVARYWVLQHTGRTSTGGGGGNVQNFPRTPGVRECYCPPEGWLYFEADYPAIELRTFAQICKWKLGWSQLADDLNAGVDVHLKVAAELLGVSYDAAATRLASGDYEVANARVAAKGINFGRKGGMSPNTFVEYAWNNYHVRVSPKQAAELVALHDRLTPEFGEYSRWVQSFERAPGTGIYDLVHPYTGRLCAGLNYTSVHNYPFQGLASDVAKHALWDCLVASHDAAHVFRRCKIVLFGHDSITGIAPRECAAEAADALAEVMRAAAEHVMPDVRTPVEAQLMTRLSKLAKPVRRDGALVPWDPWEQCEAAADRWLAAGGPLDASAIRGYLRKQRWPEYVIEDVL